MSDGEINVDSIDGEVSTSANIVGQLYPQGEKGDKGDPGNDGFSPTVTTEKVGKTTTITITDAQGEHTATILDGQDGQGSGDMLTSVYDTDHNGIVDNAEKVNGKTVLKDVPADAVFTDTTYTAGTGIDITGGVITNTQTSAEWGNITGTLSDQTDLKNALDDKANASSLSSVATSGDYSDLLNKPSIPTNTSDLTNNSGFIDKDVNNLTNYDTSTTVDTKISNSEEVLIGSDSGIKASHELWVDTSDVTPYVNSEISNDYGTAQNIGYSQNYSNTTFATKDLATMSANGLMSSADFSKLSAMAINNTYGTSSTEGYSQNYINTLNTYPSNETRVGTWYNGKPIYRRVYVYDNTTPNQNAYSIAEPSNVEHYVKLDLIQQDQDNSWIQPYFWNSTDYLRIFRSNNGIQGRTSKTGNYTHYITVEYTKTTD